jgi:hypothetical protein
MPTRGLIGGGIEIGHTRSRSMRTYTWLMVAYDSGWVPTALVGALNGMAIHRRGEPAPAGPDSGPGVRAALYDLRS